MNSKYCLISCLEWTSEPLDFWSVDHAAGGVECPDFESGAGGNNRGYTVNGPYHHKSNDGGMWIAGHYVA